MDIKFGILILLNTAPSQKLVLALSAIYSERYPKSIWVAFMMPGLELNYWDFVPRTRLLDFVPRTLNYWTLCLELNYWTLYNLLTP